MRLFFGNFGEFPFSWSSLIVDSVFLRLTPLLVLPRQLKLFTILCFCKNQNFSSVTCWVKSWITNDNNINKAFREEEASSTPQTLSHSWQWTLTLASIMSNLNCTCCVVVINQLSYDWLNTKSFSLPLLLLNSPETNPGPDDTVEGVVKGSGKIDKPASKF